MSQSGPVGEALGTPGVPAAGTSLEVASPVWDDFPGLLHARKTPDPQGAA